MAGTGPFLDRLRHRRAVARWQYLAEHADRIEPSRLDLLRSQAVETRRQIDRLVHAADARIEFPAHSCDADNVPPGTDWAWRPDPWLGRLPVPGFASTTSAATVGDRVRLFHDCPQQEIGLRQRCNPGGAGLPPFAVDLDVFGFDGSFLSLVIDLPEQAAAGLAQRHLLRLALQAESECALDLYARLNLRLGPNVEQIVRQVLLDHGPRVVEFDLAYAALSGRRVEALWLDLIFAAPAMNRITLRDLYLSRRPRADL